MDYHYSSSTNQLQTIDEFGSPVKGFKVSPVPPEGSVAFDYDQNGNIIEEPNKQITITYNHLNLPTRIVHTLGTIEFWYDAAGNKLKMEVTPTGGATVTRDYAGICEYVDGDRETIYHQHGRVLDNANGFVYQYTITDHLGNARVSFADLNNNGIIEVASSPGGYTEIVQENHYYPFAL